MLGEPGSLGNANTRIVASTTIHLIASGASPGSITTPQITENVVLYVPFISTAGARLQSVPSPDLEPTHYVRGKSMWIGTFPTRPCAFADSFPSSVY